MSSLQRLPHWSWVGASLHRRMRWHLHRMAMPKLRLPLRLPSMRWLAARLIQVISGLQVTGVGRVAGTFGTPVSGRHLALATAGHQNAGYAMAVLGAHRAATGSAAEPGPSAQPPRSSPTQLDSIRACPRYSPCAGPGGQANRPLPTWVAN